MRSSVVINMQAPHVTLKNSVELLREGECPIAFK